MNDILICLNCPVENGCVNDKGYKGRKLDCPLETVTNNNTYVTIRELAATLGIPHSTIYSRKEKLKELARHRTEKSSKNGKPTFYIHKEDAMAALKRMETEKKKRDKRVQIVFSILSDDRNKLKEIARSEGMSLSKLVNEIVMEYLNTNRLM